MLRNDRGAALTSGREAWASGATGFGGRPETSVKPAAHSRAPTVVIPYILCSTMSKIIVIHFTLNM
jgi:hypothetical protein